MGDTQDTKGRTMQNKPKTGDLFDRGADFNFAIVPLKAHRKQQCVTIRLGDERLLGDLPVAIDYQHLVGGGTAFNSELGKRVKIWKVRGT